MYRTILALLLVVSVPYAVEAQDQNKDNQQHPNRPYDVLLVKSVAGKENYNEDPRMQPAGDNQVEVVDPKSGEIVFSYSNKHRYPVEAMEWALSKSHVTALVDGTFKLHNTLRVPVSNTSLIVGPNAELSVTDAFIPNSGKPRPNHKPIIKVIRQDNVKVFNLGTLTADWELKLNGPRKDRKNPAMGVMFDGRNRGKSGIDGGVLFGTGTVKPAGNVGPAYMLIDTKNVSVPVVWSRNVRSTVMAMEGNEDTEIGLAASLRTSTQGLDYITNEIIDLNSINRRTHIHHLIGTWLDGQEEFLDVNSSPNTIVDQLDGYGTVDQSIEELIGDRGNFVDIHPYHPPENGWSITQKPFDRNNSPGTKINNPRKIEKDIKTWKTEVKTPGFPDNLPVLKINVRLTAVYEDGSTEQVFANKYRYDLSSPTNPNGK